MFKKLAATGILGFAVVGSALASTPAYASTYGGGHGHGHGHHHHGGGVGNNNHTSGNGSILGGNQVIVPISAPINVCGNNIITVGITSASCKGGASVHN
ncbi:chaplin family protein [Actinomadura geliboluensis]|uniref:DUF320 domain-containing protein n=1 Tax=Actinomadura geliboluensis TaxID=882440 RepID=A0A5S4G570_9ACTN|nr:DUF320 domain-containing protein [Actinomadura geliboluensis]TMR27992.1 DUF320 domain-containing protein [Actinomadura geliboluensis]